MRIISLLFMVVELSWVGWLSGVRATLGRVGWSEVKFRGWEVVERSYV